MKTFKEFDLRKDLLENLSKISFNKPTEVQERTMPLALAGDDIVVNSKSGTGKTGAFLIPTIQMLKPGDAMGAIVVVPTRELAIQVFDLVKKLTAGSKIKGALIYGGASMTPQIDSLRRLPNIIVGTPGRIIDFMERGELKVNRAGILILDEADVMLDMGFVEDMEYIMSVMPKDKQTMLFSATISERLSKLSRKYMKDPKYLNISRDKELTVTSISHEYAMSKRSAKIATLITYISEFKPRKSIIFSDTKRNADYLYDTLVRQGYKATVMHGDLKQSQRERALEEFRRNAQFMVATNVAARGLDVKGVSHVINYDTPSEPFVYVHRVGRSARMGADGAAFSIVSPEDVGLIRQIEQSAKIRIKQIELDGEINRKVSLEIADSLARNHERQRNETGNAETRGGYGDKVVRNKLHNKSGRSREGGRTSNSDRQHPSRSYKKW